MMLWEEDRPEATALPPNRAAELIGRPPDHRFRFEVEATAKGIHSLESLHDLGAAFTG